MSTLENMLERIRNSLQFNKPPELGLNDYVFIYDLLNSYLDTKKSSDKWVPIIDSETEYINEYQTETKSTFTISVGDSRAAVAYSSLDMLTLSPEQLTDVISEFLAFHAFRYAIKEDVEQLINRERANTKLLLGANKK